jgi:hypothetical protein
MRPTKVAFQRTVALGNYDNVRLLVEVEIEAGEGAAAAMDAARRFIQREARKHDPHREDERREWMQLHQRYQTVVANADDYAPRELKQAEQWLQNNPRPPSEDNDTDPIL